MGWCVEDRTDTPLNIKWTNKNVETLGVYFGNANPAGETFANILRKVIRSMNYWKQFRSCKLAKGRVVEIFHASEVWYAARFYPIPPPVTEAVHLALMDRLLGEQKGKSRGKDLFFTTKHNARKVLKIPSPFYTEAIKAMTTLGLRKQVLDPRDEKLFYNPIVQGRNEQTLRITKPCETAGVFTHGQEVALKNNGRPHRRHIANIFDLVILRDLDDRQHYLLNTVDGNFKFQKVTQKMVYEQLLKLHYRDHHSSAKWVEKLQTPVKWEKVWKLVHNPPSTEETASFVWEQILITKWHKTNLCCTLYTQPIRE